MNDVRRTASPMGPKLLVVSLLFLPTWLFLLFPVYLLIGLSMNTSIVLTTLWCAVAVVPPLTLFMGTVAAFRSDRRRLDIYDRTVANVED